MADSFKPIIPLAADIFRQNPMFSATHIKKEFPLLQGWKLTAALRLKGMGVDKDKVLETIKEMEASGNFPECPDLKYETHTSEVGDWNGNNYASYGDVERVIDPFTYRTYQKNNSPKE